MAALKKGAPIGITDSAYNSIRVGDTLKNIHSGLLATINKYGQFVCKITGDKLDRDGSNWIVVDDDAEPLDFDLDFDLDYRVGQEEAQAMNEIPPIEDAPKPVPAEGESQTLAEAPASEAVPVQEAGVDSPAGDLGKYETLEIIAEAKRRTDTLSYFTADEIFAELRSRGFSGSLDQEIRIIKKHTI